MHPTQCSHGNAKSMGNFFVIQDMMYDPNNQLDVVGTYNGTPLKINDEAQVVRPATQHPNKTYELYACPDCGAAVWKRID